MILTVEQLKGIIGNIYTQDKLTSIVNSLNETMTKYEINTRLRICHFLAQVLHESGAFKFMVENLNYSKDGLLKIFPRYFTPLTALQYERKPELIANKVYSNRMGNGNEASGNGYKFRGRGYIQITGKNNYKALSQSVGVDFVSQPELLEQDKYVSLSAGWFWSNSKLNIYADKDDILTITKKINGGTNGYNDRCAWLTKCKNVIK